LPAAPAIALSLDTIAVKTTPVAAAPATADTFGQVLRSVWGPATGPVSPPPPANDAQAEPAQGVPDPEAAALAEAAASQVATVTTALTAGAAAPRVTAPGEKPVHPGKDDSHAAATQTTVPPATDPTALTPGLVSLAAVEAGAVPAVMPNQTPAPPAGTARLGAVPIPANPTRTILAPDAASAHTAPVQNGQETSPQTVSADPTAAQNDRVIPSPVAMPAQGISLPGTVPSPPASTGKASDTKGQSPQEPQPAPAASAPDVGATALVASAYPAGALTAVGEAATADHRRAVASKTSASLAPNSSAGRDTASSPAHDLSAPSGQPAATTTYSGTPSQPARAAVADATSQQTTPAPPPLPLPVVPADTAGSAAASATDHKVTLRPAEAAADPAQPVATSAATLDQVIPTGTPPTVPTTTSVAAAQQAHPASPAEQVAPALLTLAKTADGSQQMTVRLQPAGLGMVQVRIAQAASGTTQIEITADNPATLLALQRDQPQLHHTLDDAGIPAAGRIITFHAAEVTQTTASANASGTGHGDSQQSPAGRNSAGSADADGSAAGGRGSYPARERNTYPAGRRSDAPPETAGAAVATAGKSYRIGLDITA
jgi:flagellar hook-length control protein FliK